MAKLAQFIGEEAVAKLSDTEIERACDILDAEMLKHALTNDAFKKELSVKAQKVTAGLIGSRKDRG